MDKIIFKINRLSYLINGKMSSNNLKIIKFSSPPWIIWTISLFIFWPGMMSHDSIIQWRQIINNNIVDYQPALHTILMWIITRIHTSPAVVALAQIFILGLSSGWVLKNIYDWGVDIKLIWIASCIIALSPINIVMSITIWKDIPYTAIIVFITGSLFLVVPEGIKKTLHNSKFLILLGILFSIAALLRWNGAVVAFFCIIAIVFITRRLKSAIYVTSIFLFIIIIFRGPVFSLFNISTSKYIFYTLPLHHMGAFISSNVPFTEDEKSFLNNISPIKDNWQYDCHAIRKAFGAKPGINLIYDKQYLIDNGQRFLKLYLKTLFNNPLVYLKHLKCSAKFIWYPWSSMERMQLKTVGGIRWIPYENEFGIISDSKLPSFVVPATMFIKSTMFIWQPSIFLLFCIIIYLVSYNYQRNLLLLLSLIPLLSQTIGIAILTNSQEFRYQYPVVFIAHFIWLLIFKKNDKKLLDG